MKKLSPISFSETEEILSFIPFSPPAHFDDSGDVGFVDYAGSPMELAEEDESVSSSTVPLGSFSTYYPTNDDDFVPVPMQRSRPAPPVLVYEPTVEEPPVLLPPPDVMVEDDDTYRPLAFNVTPLDFSKVIEDVVHYMDEDEPPEAHAPEPKPLMDIDEEYMQIDEEYMQISDDIQNAIIRLDILIREHHIQTPLPELEYTPTPYRAAAAPSAPVLERVKELEFTLPSSSRLIGAAPPSTPPDSPRADDMEDRRQDFLTLRADLQGQIDRAEAQRDQRLEAVRDAFLKIQEANRTISILEGKPRFKSQIDALKASLSNLQASINLMEHEVENAEAIYRKLQNKMRTLEANYADVSVPSSNKRRRFE